MEAIQINEETLAVEPVTCPAIRIEGEAFEVRTVTNPVERDNALAVCKAIKSKSKELEEQRKAITGPMDTAKKQVMAFFKRPMDLLEKAERGLKQAILNYDEAERRARAIEEARIKAKLEAEAEKQRLALKAEAAELIKEGDEATARAVFAESKLVQAPTVALAAPVQNVGGSSTRTRWLAEIVDINLVPREYLVPDYKRLRDLANANKGTNPPPGVTFFPDVTLAVRI